MNPWSERNLLRESLAESRGIVADQRDTIAEQEATIAYLRHQLDSANDLIARMNERADKLLAKVYEHQKPAAQDCFARCFVAYAGKDYDAVCVRHFDEIGRELSRG